MRYPATKICLSVVLHFARNLWLWLVAKWYGCFIGRASDLRFTGRGLESWLGCMPLLPSCSLWVALNGIVVIFDV